MECQKFVPIPYSDTNSVAENVQILVENLKAVKLHNSRCSRLVGMVVKIPSYNRRDTYYQVTKISGKKFFLSYVAINIDGGMDEELQEGGWMKTTLVRAIINLTDGQENLKNSMAKDRKYVIKPSGPVRLI